MSAYTRPMSAPLTAICPMIEGFMPGPWVMNGKGGGPKPPGFASAGRLLGLGLGLGGRLRGGLGGSPGGLLDQAGLVGGVAEDHAAVLHHAHDGLLAAEGLMGGH